MGVAAAPAGGGRGGLAGNFKLSSQVPQVGLPSPDLRQQAHPPSGARRGCMLRSSLRSIVALSATSRVPGLITFDCTGTLFEGIKPVGEQYMQALCEVRGGAAVTLDESALDRAFLTAYNRATSERPCFGYGQCEAYEWWRDVVYESFSTAGLPADASAALLPDTFDILWHRFCTRDGFQLRAHAGECLERLHAWRESQPEGERTRIAVISNWDDRLPALLDDLGVLSDMDAVITSREIGAEKPDSRIFEAARERLGVPRSARCIHIGDSWSRDVLGAHDSGFEPVFVCPPSHISDSVRAQMERADVPHTYLESLSTLPGHLGIGR